MHVLALFPYDLCLYIFLSPIDHRNCALLRTRVKPAWYPVSATVRLISLYAYHARFQCLMSPLCILQQQQGKACSAAAEEKVGLEPANSLHQAECTSCQRGSLGETWSALQCCMVAKVRFKETINRQSKGLRVGLEPVPPMRLYRKHALHSHRVICVCVKPCDLFQRDTRSWMTYFGRAVYNV